MWQIGPPNHASTLRQFIVSWTPSSNYGCAVDGGGPANHDAFNGKTKLVINGSPSSKGTDNLACICRLGPRAKVGVVTLTCHPTSICGFGSGGIHVGEINHLVGNCCALGWTCHSGICCDGCAPPMGSGVGSGGIPQLGGMVQLGCHFHHPTCVICHMPNCIWGWGTHGQDVSGN